MVRSCSPGVHSGLICRSSKEKAENDKKDKKARKKEDQPFKLDLMKILPRFHFEFRQDGTFPDITRNEVR